jgi:hypothetical protein
MKKEKKVQKGEISSFLPGTNICFSQMLKLLHLNSKLISIARSPPTYSNNSK